ncbi:MAG TPA: hypothetical protein VN455_06435 [Methanotrichaceae archaeon]|nr:hypothetical protein [Methanotrichaceae archaeon]
MRVSITLFACLAAMLLMASFLPSAISQENPASGNTSVNVDRYGSPSTVNVDRYGSKPVYDIEKYSNAQPVYDVSKYSNIQPAFNVSQRGGMRSTYGYQYTISAQPIWTQPVYNVSEFSTTLPVQSVGQSSMAGQVSSRVGGAQAQVKPVRVGAATTAQQ